MTAVRSLFLAIAEAPTAPQPTGHLVQSSAFSSSSQPLGRGLQFRRDFRHLGLLSLDLWLEQAI
jgi:hypothetical protein